MGGSAFCDADGPGFCSVAKMRGYYELGLLLH